MTPEKRELMRKALEAADALDTDEYRELCAAAERKAAMEKAAADAEAALGNVDFQIPQRGAKEADVTPHSVAYPGYEADDDIFDEYQPRPNGSGI